MGFWTRVFCATAFRAVAFRAAFEAFVCWVFDFALVAFARLAFGAGRVLPPRLPPREAPRAVPAAAFRVVRAGVRAPDRELFRAAEVVPRAALRLAIVCSLWTALVDDAVRPKSTGPYLDSYR